jgi:acetyltransferase-like isoleucine patch superfamily enzyme
VDRSCRIIGWKNIAFSGPASIGANSFINVNSRNTDKICLKIGANVYLGRNNFISVGDQVEICDFVLTANNCALIGSHHIYDNPMIPYALSGTTSSNKIRIGPNVFIGYGATIIGNISIGFGSVIGAHCYVNFNVPPLSLVVGSPAKVVKHFDLDSGMWLTGTAEAPMNEEIYLEILRTHKSEIILPFFAGSSGLGDL